MAERTEECNIMYVCVCVQVQLNHESKGKMGGHVCVCFFFCIRKMLSFSH